jgi:hypothetical protein
LRVGLHDCFTACICGSRLPASFLVDGKAAINVASTIVPPHSKAPRASSCFATAFEHCLRQFVPQSRCRKLKIVVSSGIGSCPSSRCRTSASNGYRTALPRRPDQNECTIAAGSRCATSWPSETLHDRPEDLLRIMAARLLLPALTTAPPPPISARNTSRFVRFFLPSEVP